MADELEEFQWNFANFYGNFSTELETNFTTEFETILPQNLINKFEFKANFSRELQTNISTEFRTILTNIFNPHLNIIIILN